MGQRRVLSRAAARAPCFDRHAAPADWEVFVLEAAGPHCFAIRSCHGYVLSAQPDGRIERRPGIGGDWEKFTLQRSGDGSVSFRSEHGAYLCFEGGLSVVWNRPAFATGRSSNFARKHVR